MIRNSLFVSILIIALLIVENSAEFEFNVNTVCSVIKNGSFIRHPSSCSSWINCVNEEPIIGTCVGDLLFDQTLEKCVEKTKVNCFDEDPQKLCNNVKLHGTFVRDPKSCDGYYYCSNDGIGIQGYCLNNQQFNPKTLMCDYSYNCNDIINNVCDLIGDKKLFGNPKKCSNYYYCLKGDLKEGVCPNGLHFDIYTGGCNDQNLVGCTFEFVPTPGYQQNTTCGTAANPINLTYVSDGITCDGYFECKKVDNGVDLTPTYHKCNLQQYFDQTLQKCIHRTNVKCEFNRCIGMGSRYANQNNDDCRGYLICMDDEIISYVKCPENYYFNEISQICIDEKISYAACAKS